MMLQFDSILGSKKQRLGIDLSWKSAKIEDVHTVLTDGLDVGRNLRHARVFLIGGGD